MNLYKTYAKAIREVESENVKNKNFRNCFINNIIIKETGVTYKTVTTRYFPKSPLLIS